MTKFLERLLDICAIMVIIATSAAIAWVSLDSLSNLGVFGSCFEGGCGYEAIFVGFPLITGTLALCGMWLWFWWSRRPSRANTTNGQEGGL